MGKRRPANAQIRKLEKCTEELAGLVAKIRISMSEGEAEVSRESLDCDLSPEQIKTQQQQDLAWLIGHPDLIELNQGNYVGLYKRAIIAAAPSEHLVRIVAARKRDVNVDEILIVPVRVPGSKELWEEIEAMMEKV